jgi:hypothetical protein
MTSGIGLGELTVKEMNQYRKCNTAEQRVQFIRNRIVQYFDDHYGYTNHGLQVQVEFLPRDAGNFYAITASYTDNFDFVVCTRGHLMGDPGLFKKIDAGCALEFLDENIDHLFTNRYVHRHDAKGALILRKRER